MSPLQVGGGWRGKVPPDPPGNRVKVRLSELSSQTALETNLKACKLCRRRFTPANTCS